MADIIVNVQDFPYVVSNTINNVRISVGQVILFKSVHINALLLQDNNLVESKFFTITGDEYNNWSNDDQYLVDLVMSKLGMTPINVTVTTQ
jgi:hypothetical protein